MLLTGFKTPGSKVILGAVGVVALFVVVFVSSGRVRSDGPDRQSNAIQTEQVTATEPMLSAEGTREPAPDPEPDALAIGVVAQEPIFQEPSIAEAKDPAGVTPRQRLEYLHNAHDYLLKTYASEHAASGQVAQLHQSFLLRCVGTLLHAQGRVGFPSELTEEESKKYSMNAASPPDRIVFSQDGAWYEFFRGEFPQYDMALDDLAVAADAGRSPGAYTCPHSETLYEQALATFNVSPIRNEPIGNQK